MLDGYYRDGAKALIVSRFKGSPEDGEAVASFLGSEINLLRSVCERIVVAYNKGCRRTHPTRPKEFADFVAATGFARRAQGLARRTWVAGPHVVIPYHDKERRQVRMWEVPPNAIAEMDGDPELDEITAIRFEPGAITRHRAHRAQNTRHLKVLVDDRAWHVTDADGVTTTTPHGVGRCPAVVYRITPPGSEEDWYGAMQRDSLYQQTLGLAYKMALALYLRQVAGLPLTTIFADLDKMPKGQVLGHPFQALLLAITDRVQVDDKRIVDAAQLLAELEAMITMAVTSAGLPTGTLTSRTGAIVYEEMDDALAAQRDEQVLHLAPCERRLWRTALEVAHGSGLTTIPVADVGIAFPDLRGASTQRKEIAALADGLRYGLTNPADHLQERRPELTAEDAQEIVDRNLALYVATFEPLVSRQVPATQGQTLPAEDQGREGGLASGASRRKPEDVDA